MVTDWLLAATAFVLLITTVVVLCMYTHLEARIQVLEARYRDLLDAVIAGSDETRRQAER